MYLSANRYTEMIDVTDEERRLIGFALACYIEDTEKAIKRPPKCVIMIDGGKMAKERLATIQRLTYTKVIPDSLTGDLELADGTILRKET